MVACSCGGGGSTDRTGCGYEQFYRLVGVFRRVWYGGFIFVVKLWIVLDIAGIAVLGNGFRVYCSAVFYGFVWDFYSSVFICECGFGWLVWVFLGVEVTSMSVVREWGYRGVGGIIGFLLTGLDEGVGSELIEEVGR